ncbi:MULTISPECIES: hypothetical protein [Clostridia]|uniref:hypothetical protein n=1 Tax=Clostridia TaxID=186801 RepID=UPI00067EFDCF|nr:MULTISPECIES: hypothetical protein [Clostridia]
MSKTYSIKTEDPLGNTIVCTEERWNHHILNDSEHTIMKGNEIAVADTLRDPDTIYVSSQNENRTVYFKKGANSTYSKTLTTKVVTETVGSKSKKVVTAFPQKSEKGGISDVIYTRPK